MPAVAETVLYSEPEPGVARITLNRPERRNAQNVTLIYALDAAFQRAARTAEVRVIILDAAGDAFSSGHDLKGDDGAVLEDFPLVGLWGDFAAPGQEGMMGREWEIYLGMCERWRSLPKPTIAQVQGKCIAGGLMLAWVCDLITASEDASFQDPVLSFGICGSEFFMHPFELGPRRAKEWLFTSGWLSAAEAREAGMVNRVYPAERLAEETLALAVTIARKPPFALKMAKEAINQSQDAAGRRTALLQSFSIHQLCHSHWRSIYGIPVYPDGLPSKLRDGIYRYFDSLGRRAPDSGN